MAKHLSDLARLFISTVYRLFFCQSAFLFGIEEQYCGVHIILISGVIALASLDALHFLPPFYSLAIAHAVLHES